MGILHKFECFYMGILHILYNDRQFLEGRQPNSICPSFVLYLFMFVIPCVIDVYVANKILSRITDFKQYLFYFGQ